MTAGSIIILTIVFRDVSFGLIVSRLSDVDLRWLLVAVICGFFAIFFRSLRWQVLLNHRMDTATSFYIVSIGMLMNQLPMRVGDILRASLARREQIPFVLSLTTLVVENIIDLFLVVVLLFISIQSLAQVPDEVSFAMQIFGVLTVVAFAVLWILINRANQVRALLHHMSDGNALLGRLDLERRFNDLVLGSQAIASWRSASQLAGASLALWVANIAVFYTLTRAFDLQYDTLLQWSVVSVMLISLGVAIPISVAGIGPYQAAVVIAGNLLGIEMVDALLLGVITHGISLLTFVIWGLVGINGLKLSYGDIASSFKKIKPDISDRKQSSN